MAHFAKVLEGRVIDIIVAELDFFDSFVDNSPGTWLQCSYNTRGGVHYDPETGEASIDQSKALRYNYPAVGYNYDYDGDAFYSEQPFDSWSLNTDNYLWEPPVPIPDENTLNYYWDEDQLNWIPLSEP